MKNSMILIVEDEMITALDIKMRLESLGYTVSGITASGEDALKKVKNEKIDLAIMDIKLDGEISGIETAVTFWREYNIPIIFMTASSDRQTLQESLQSEPYGYLHKPVDINDLRYTVEMALYKHSIDMRLAESEARYKTLFQNMVQGAFVQDADGSLVDVNPAALRIFGMDREIFLKKNSFDTAFRVIKEDGSPMPAEEHPSIVALKENKRIHGAVAGIVSHDSGECTWVVIDAIPVCRHEEQKACRVFVTLHDISGERNILEKLQLQSQMLDAVGQAVIATDLKGNFIYMNREAERLFECSGEKVRTKNLLAEFMTEPDALRSQGTKERLESGQTCQGRMQLRKNNGELFEAMVTYSPLYDVQGQWSGVVGTVFDLSEVSGEKQSGQK